MTNQLKETPQDSRVVSSNTTSNLTFVSSLLLVGSVAMLIGFGASAFFLLKFDQPAQTIAEPESDTSEKKSTTVIERTLEKTREILPAAPTTIEGTESNSDASPNDSKSNADASPNNSNGSEVKPEPPARSSADAEEVIEQPEPEVIQPEDSLPSQ